MHVYTMQPLFFVAGMWLFGGAPPLLLARGATSSISAYWLINGQSLGSLSVNLLHWCTTM